MKRFCALCDVLGLSPQLTQSTVGLLTAHSGLLALAEQHVSERAGGETHIIVPMCPEHVVDVYRGRIEGVAMAWRVAQASY